MSFWDDFRKFAIRGNALDLTVGVVVGGAFGKIVTSLVNDIVLPPVGLLLGKVDFSNLFFALGAGTYSTLAEAKKAGVPVLSYGAFLSSILDFGIVAFCIFLAVRWLERFRLLTSVVPGDAPLTKSEKLLEEIRDEIRGKTPRG
ncbi:MAG: mechanosensitive ion channel protein MscL [Verrucomicrobia subdivision 6 bacterium BACL9 MAG-120820-bin42]|jgi:large conductance mechanosensitive channel|uniref:Large-conductance mechanosensitive channel n=1 Tax=Verrucomicrobia subdivision 6 bacterium BACL9 MAG-120820-bin42 TaxID=1655634 RepID=A0A0R2X9X0_9BACT|nr:MAG: mechanosensitive ion channel protein MscL [Verrucomicrobia subdivision 6 bacterium BACL9 MAG-120820-bin42]